MLLTKADDHDHTTTKGECIMLFAYLRVSTAKQDLKRQHDNIRKVYDETQLPENRIYSDTWTGTTMNRPNWNRLLDKAKQGDCIIFDSVSRMSRDAEEGMQEYEELLKRGIELRFLNEPAINSAVFTAAAERRISIATTTGKASTDNLLANIENAINEFMLDLAKEQVRIAFEQAQKERDDLSKRTVDGIAAAMRRREETGQPLPTHNKGAKLVTKKEKAAKEIILKHSKSFGGNLSDAECMKLIGCAKNSFYKYKAACTADEIVKAGE